MAAIINRELKGGFVAAHMAPLHTYIDHKARTARVTVGFWKDEAAYLANEPAALEETFEYDSAVFPFAEEFAAIDLKAKTAVEAEPSIAG